MAQEKLRSIRVEKSEPKPLNKKPLGYAIAAIAGLSAWPIGFILSPASLFICNQFTPCEQKQKDGKTITVTAWTAWISIGIITTPVLWLLGILSTPSTTTKPAKTETVASAYRGGAGDAEAAVKAWIRENEIKGRWTCEDAIKRKLNDPRSMETREVTYQAAPDTSTTPPQWRTRVEVVFGARNGFGGMITATGRCLFDENGNPIEFEGIQQ
jgi:hypothetical protein